MQNLKRDVLPRQGDVLSYLLTKQKENAGLYMINHGVCAIYVASR